MFKNFFRFFRNFSVISFAVCSLSGCINSQGPVSNIAVCTNPSDSSKSIEIETAENTDEITRIEFKNGFNEQVVMDLVDGDITDSQMQQAYNDLFNEQMEQYQYFLGVYSDFPFVRPSLDVTRDHYELSLNVSVDFTDDRCDPMNEQFQDVLETMGLDGLYDESSGIYRYNENTRTSLEEGYSNFLSCSYKEE